MLEFQSQPLSELRLRFPKALIEYYNLSEKIKNPEKRPGAYRSNVFDFDDGIRLIVSLDNSCGIELVTVSASHEPKIYKGPKGDILLKHMLTKVGQLTGCYNIKYAGLDGDIPHWVIKKSNIPFVQATLN